ncbi:EAL domain-containing protein [Pseudomonas sp. KSR10]|uniref:bifunctional diguanylate cyclase/phosphodiesterase n=1 Tax=Pseudomonadaceae TaxID=135621 RepID=UPI0005EB927C|nr:MULTISPECIES: EAL domain-containing protein [Pseudomonadaceae]MCG6542181.1 EAL domain-containing protein [Pseudomonas sp. KSR10]
MPSDSASAQAGSPKAHAAFSRRILPGFACLLAAALLAAAIAVIHIAQTIDRDALTQEHFLAGKAFESHMRGMSRHVADNGFWGDAYANLSKRTNLNWAYDQANLGPSLYDDFGYEAVLVVNADGETTYSVIRGELVQVDARRWLGNGLEILLAQAREAVEEEETSAGLLSAEGLPAMVAAAVMTPGGSDIDEMDGPASVLLFVDVMDSDWLLQLGREYAIEGLRIDDENPRPQNAVVSLNMLDGTFQGFTWNVSQPGRYLLWMTLPVLAAVTLGLGVLAWLLLRQALKTVRLMDASYKRLSKSRTALAASEERFRDVAEAASDWIWETDQNARLTYLSSRFEEITGHEPAAWIGRPLIDLLITDHAALQDWLAAPHRTPLRCSYQAANGCERHCRLSARAIYREDELLGYRGTASDITEETRAQARVQYLSQHDALTGLPNRNRLRDYLEAKLASLSSGSRLTVLYIDLDRFKPVNDTLGHGAGDEVLIGVSNRLKQCIRGDDLVARLGGDEFLMVMSRLQLNEDVDKLCARVVAAVSEPFIYEGQQIYIGASIGIAMAPTDATQANELLRCADIALYQAKADGRGTWRFYGSEMDKRLLERRRQEDELRQAIAEGQFEVHYQPRYFSEDMSINGAEALLRWRHPARGLLLPEHFIPLAEETGLIVPLGEWVLRQACIEATGWASTLMIAVNLSPLQLRNDELSEMVRTVLEESGLPANRLELEITETALLQENQRTLDVLNELKAIGVRLAMDDFGTGYSSLSNLRSYPFDTIKIDGSFVSGMERSTADHSIVKALIDLGRGLRMRVTAEGVETSEQLTQLLADGCSEIQGFHMSHPLPAQELRALLAGVGGTLSRSPA